MFSLTMYRSGEMAEVYTPPLHFLSIIMQRALNFYTNFDDVLIKY